MGVRRWTITTYASGKQRDIDIVLYDNAARMRTEATKHANNIGEANTSFADAHGVCHGFERFHIAASGTETLDPLSAIIRLHRDQLTPIVISHEVAHAAQHIYGLDLIGDNHDARDHFTAGNEDFAWLYGELFAAAWTALKNGVNDE